MSSILPPSFADLVSPVPRLSSRSASAVVPSWSNWRVVRQGRCMRAGVVGAIPGGLRESPLEVGGVVSIATTISRD